ncbi:hypothetical protein LuPra_05167 [Luteitalea pratensis]|uniref:Uncharacterized protein n=1 Tax=Luteitalea pratensis TaxID=1855912 RepID=A0A143PVS8_LUTPR|nr:hypothetical protein [Luteitalea pratensis]AMY11899.1 hypothetical protein LuPra_05167 [Luteitalea pratensis]
MSVLNFPTFRQLYLPLAGVAVLLYAWKPAGFRRAGRCVAGLVILSLVVLYQTVAPAMVRSGDRVAQRAAGARLEVLLAGVQADMAVVQIGQSSCGYSLSFDARGREVWKLIPATNEGGVPLRRSIDDRTVEVLAPNSTTLAVSTMVPPDLTPRRARIVPPLIAAGWQRLPVATAHTPRQSKGAVTSFRLTFDRPLTAYVFLHVSGCVELGRWRPT